MWKELVESVMGAVSIFLNTNAKRSFHIHERILLKNFLFFTF